MSIQYSHYLTPSRNVKLVACTSDRPYLELSSRATHPLWPHRTHQFYQSFAAPSINFIHLLFPIFLQIANSLRQLLTTSRCKNRSVKRVMKQVITEIILLCFFFFKRIYNQLIMNPWHNLTCAPISLNFSNGPHCKYH